MNAKRFLEFELKHHSKMNDVLIFYDAFFIRSIISVVEIPSV